jgi:hypothetical protein
MVITEGARGDGLYVILAGEVEVLREGIVAGTSARRRLRRDVAPRRGPAVATVRNLRRTSLLRLPPRTSPRCSSVPAVASTSRRCATPRSEINARLPLTPDDEPLFVV